MDKDRVDNLKLERFESSLFDFGDAAFTYYCVPPQDSFSHLNAYIAAVECGCYPPLETIYWIYEAFKKYETKSGDRDLIDLLGLNPGPGHPSVFTIKNKEKAVGDIARDVRAILPLLDFNVAKACRAVEEKCAAGLYEYFKKKNVPSQRTIRNYYKREKFRLGPFEGRPHQFYMSILLVGRSETMVALPPVDDAKVSDLHEKFEKQKKKLKEEKNQA